MTVKLQPVDENVSLPKMEEAILAHWEANDIFLKSVEEGGENGDFVFYDGPPFATGLPHYGHLLAGTLKDIIPRYWTMKGKRVERRFGWDCHGVPVEYEIQQSLNLDGSTAIEDFGIGNFNEACREIVLRYSKDWESTVKRMGRWVDFRHTYRTMDKSFMESIWWVFSQMFDKGLIYKGHKVVPFSPALGTPLSNFEANQNYQDVQDPAITVSFPLADEPETSLLAWTTTPWTLISNLALTVGADIDYVTVVDAESGSRYILAEARLDAYYKKEEEYEVVAHCKGADLVGRVYTPLFDYFADRREEGAFRVLAGDFVTTADGTGIVHTAPAFGEDDFFVCGKEGIKLVCPVDVEGKFTDEVPDHQDVFVKDADKAIIKRLKDAGRLVHQGTINHSYPFCWRSDTPLIYRAISTWYVSVDSIKDKLVSRIPESHWVPEHLGEGRFGNWLRGARDWAISRNRYWGTPLPLWQSEDGEEIVCIHSIEELEELSGQKVDDLHRHHVDDITIPSREGRGELRRVSEVLDCWFESGSMPYAQQHYPFENKEKFESSFPADFIAEGVDQTTLWFYVLTVISTAVFDKPAFKNVVVNGIVLAEDGKKMSKRLKNYPDPVEVIDRHGADAVRLFMINSPAARAEDLRFAEEGVRDIVRRVLLPWWNSYKFFVTYARLDDWRFDPDVLAERSDNILDRVLLSRLQTLVGRVEREMSQYHMYNVVTPLLEFIDQLTNNYIRLNRRRFWGDDERDKNHAYHTLYKALTDLARLMAPFTPFIADEMFRNLSRAENGSESVHLERFPEVDESFVDRVLEDAVARVQEIFLMGRNIRTTQKVKTKIPLDTLTILHRRQEILDEIKPLEGYIKSELNVKEVVYSTDEDAHIRLTAKPNFKTLGPRLGKGMGKMAGAFKQLNAEDILTLESGGAIEVNGETIAAEDAVVHREALDGADAQTNRFITILMPTEVTEENRREGLAREIVGRIQNMRKDAGFAVEDRIAVTFAGSKELCDVAEEHGENIANEILATSYKQGAVFGFYAARLDIDGEELVVGIARV